MFELPENTPFSRPEFQKVLSAARLACKLKKGQDLLLVESLLLSFPSKLRVTLWVS